MVCRFNPQLCGPVTEHFGAEGDGDVTTPSDGNRGAAIIRGYEDSFVAAADVHTHDGQRDSAGIAERQTARALGKHGLIAEPQHTRLKRSAYRAVRRIIDKTHRAQPRAHDGAVEDDGLSAFIAHLMDDIGSLYEGLSG